MILAILAALTATPATHTATMSKARCGDVVTLANGSYPTVVAPRLTCPDDNRLTIDASAATIKTATIRAVEGLDWSGGTFNPPLSTPVAMTIDMSRRVRFSGALITGARVGVTIARSSYVVVRGNRFDGVRSDGVNVTIAHHVDIIGNQCLRFQPILATYDAAGKLLVDGDHPDCVQGWTTQGTPPLSDVLVAGNTAEGFMQGAWFGKTSTHGYDRITIRNNDFRIGAFQGASVIEGRGTVIRDNRILPTPGARLQGGNRGLVWPWVYTTGDAVACGNVVAAQASRYGTGACK
jgi:hypothetical protein